MKALSASFAALALAISPATAQMSLSEVRVGAGVTNMELILGIVPEPDSFHIENLDGAQIDVFFELPDAKAFKWLNIGNPRLEFGGMFSMAGRESNVHAGINWHYPLFDTPLYIEAGLGLGVHNGATTGAVAPMRNLGCPFGIHYTYGIGAEVGEHFTITGRFQHLSHAYICPGPNDGLNSLSLALGYRF